MNNFCLNSVNFGIVGTECEDLSGTVSTGGGAGQTADALCLTKVNCVLGSSCAVSDVSSCYCGTLTGSTCSTSSSPGDGACAAAEANGVGHFSTDAASVVSPLLADSNSASGKADAIFSCSLGNGCGPMCNQ